MGGELWGQVVERDEIGKEERRMNQKQITPTKFITCISRAPGHHVHSTDSDLIDYLPIPIPAPNFPFRYGKEKLQAFKK
jgi:hypothetical protein